MTMNLQKSITALLLILLLSSCNDSAQQSIIWVSGIKSECSAGAGKMDCMSIYKGENLENANWETFYGQIEGFEFEEGYLKKIKVSESKIDNPPADGATIQYTMVEELDKQEDSRMGIGKNWLLAKLKGGPINRMVAVPNLEVRLANMQIGGAGGCNLYSAAITSLTAQNISFGNIMSTKKACIGKNIEQEYFEVLATVNSYSLENNMLNFYDMEGNNVLSYIEQMIDRGNREGLAGGWNEAEIDENIEAATAFILESTGTDSSLKAIISAKKQVVAGMNYDVTFELENGETWQAIVYQNLNGEYSMLQEPKQQ